MGRLGEWARLLLGDEAADVEKGKGKEVRRGEGGFSGYWFWW